VQVAVINICGHGYTLCTSCKKLAAACMSLGSCILYHVLWQHVFDWWWSYWY